jgi:hypothetical protein
VYSSLTCRVRVKSTLSVKNPPLSAAALSEQFLHAHPYLVHLHVHMDHIRPRSSADHCIMVPLRSLCSNPVSQILPRDPLVSRGIRKRQPSQLRTGPFILDAMDASNVFILKTAIPLVLSGHGALRAIVTTMHVARLLLGSQHLCNLFVMSCGAESVSECISSPSAH